MYVLEVDMVQESKENIRLLLSLNLPQLYGGLKPTKGYKRLSDESKI